MPHVSNVKRRAEWPRRLTAAVTRGDRRVSSIWPAPRTPC